jgi:hypothetical protein
MPTIDVKDAAGVTRTIQTIPVPGQQNDAGSQPVTLSTEQAGQLTSMVDSLVALVETLGLKQALGFYPGFTEPPIGELRGMTFDQFGSLYTRGGVTTDEGSFRLNFSGASLALALPGTPTFTNLSRVVTAAGILAMDPPLLVGDYVKLDADAESAWARVYSIDSDAQITLAEVYTGTGGTGAASFAGLKTSTGAGMSIAVSGGNKIITCGTTAAVTTTVLREVDYGPLIYQSGFSVSQRIANQDIYRGFTAPNGQRRYFAHFRFTGTTDTVVACETGWARTAPASGTDVQATTVTLPNGLTSATTADYRIELRGEVVTFYVNDVPLATHKNILPKPYDVLAVGTVIINGTTPASSTTVVVGYECCNNVDSLRMSIANQTDGVLALQPPAVRVPASSRTSTGVLFTIDTTQTPFVCVNVTSAGTTCTITYEHSTDGGTTWNTLAGSDPSGNNAGAGTSTTAIALHFYVPGQAFRARVSTYTSGTVTAHATARAVGVMNRGSMTVTASNLSCNIAQMNGVTVAMNNGVAGTGVQRVAIASDNTANSNPWRVTAVPSGAQGASTTHHAISAASTNATSVTAVATTANTISCSNTNASPRYLKLYNKASAPTVGTDTPVATILLKPGETTVVDCGAYGRRFSLGLGYALTTGIAVADTGAVAASEHAVEMSYAT